MGIGVGVSVDVLGDSELCVVHSFEEVMSFRNLIESFHELKDWHQHKYDGGNVEHVVAPVLLKNDEKQAITAIFNVTGDILLYA